MVSTLVLDSISDKISEMHTAMPWLAYNLYIEGKLWFLDASVLTREQDNSSEIRWW